MVVIEVDEKDVAKVFEILIGNGSFTQLSINRFRIDEHAEKTIEKIKAVNIRLKILDSREQKVGE